MTWYVIAFVMFPWSIEPEYKINTMLRFSNYETCNEYLTQNNDGLARGLRKAYPDIDKLTIRCVNADTARRMQEDMEEREQKGL
jgi:hypothetical protein